MRKRLVWRALGLPAITVLLMLAFPAGPAGGEKPMPASVNALQDNDGDKIFDDLERLLAPAGSGDRFATIVLLNQPLTFASEQALRAGVGPFTVTYRYPSINGFAATLTEAQILALARLDSVAQIEPDREVVAFLDKARHWFGVDKAVADFGFNGNADGNAASYSTNDIVIAVLDTGIYTGHQDLPPSKVLAWVDFHEPVTGPDPLCTQACDPEGHGTHVSSIAAGTGAASGGAFKGAAPGAALVGVRVLNKNGSGPTSVINAGIQWVIDNKAAHNIRIFNMSLGVDGCFSGSDSMSQLVNTAVTVHGLVAVIAAGNEGPGTCTVAAPGVATQAITVGAMADPEHGTASPDVCDPNGIGPAPAGGYYLVCFSSRGPRKDGAIKPDIVAPGVRINGAKAGTSNQYFEASGTSMATPFTAGVAALMLHANPALTPAQVKSTLMNTAIDWGPAGPDIDYGAGRLNGYEAVRAAAAASGTDIALPLRSHVSDSLAASGQPGDTDNHLIKVTNASVPLAVTVVIPSWKPDLTVDFDAVLFDGNGVEVGRSESASRQETIGLASPTNGPYTLRIFAWPGAPPRFPPSLGGTYFFDLSAGACLDNGAADLDSDGFSNVVEASAGTDACSRCGTDAWPADFNNDKFADITDISLVAASFGQGVPPAPSRRDVAPSPTDGFIDISDVAGVAGFFGQACSDPPRA